MPDHDPDAYGDRMSGVYDEWFGTPADAEEAVAFLSDLAGRGRVLELGIGTGRVLPGRAALAPALGRLAPRTFHRLEHEPRLGL